MVDVERGQAVAEVQVHEQRFPENQSPPVIEELHGLEPLDIEAFQDPDLENRRLVLTAENAAIRSRWIRTVFFRTTLYMMLTLETLLVGCILLCASNLNNNKNLFHAFFVAVLVTFLFTILAVTFAEYTCIDVSKHPISAVCLILLCICHCMYFVYSQRFIPFIIAFGIMVLLLLWGMTLILQGVFGGREWQFERLDEETTWLVAGGLWVIVVMLFTFVLFLVILIDQYVK